MSRKTFVLDTNVLLYDPSSIKQFQDNDVVIPLIVLEELDALKRRSDELGKNARQVVRYIDSLKTKKKGDLNKGIIIDEGPTIKIFLDIKTRTIKRFPLPLDRNSNKILHISSLLKNEGQKVVFVSKDFVTRVKAEAMGLEAQDYENLKVSYKKIYKGIKILETSKKEIDLFYKDGQITKADINFLPNEYCILKSLEKSSAICKYNSNYKKLEPLIEYKKGIWGIYPLNVEQRCVIDLLLRDDIKLVTLVGAAGTGKTLLALACGMKKVFDDALYSKILVSRPIIPLGKDIGYLPGTKEEKLFHWMQPIYDNLEVLLHHTNGEGNEKSAFDWIMDSNKLEMEAVTYIRGRTLPKVYMIIDEAQNLTPHEVKTIISRAGKGTKVILTGDPTQIDNPYLDQDSNGLTYTISKFQDQKLYGHIFLDKTERSELAKIAADIM
ncbi:MAG: PhoH-like protein [Candidatus Anoxychlamydiales bacterium]|nr:PhoH-like protein [Candidatus Anoxychlamydiales bacterium]